MVVFAGDIGKAQTKVMIGKVGVANPEIVKAFPTKYTLTPPYDKVDNVTFTGVNGNEVTYYLDDVNGQDTKANVSKTDDIHKANFFCALGRYVKNGEHIEAGFCLPLTECQDSNKVEEFKKHMIGDGNISFKFNGQQMNYTINSITVFPECLGYTLIKDISKEKASAILDFGGYNCNAVQIRNGRLVQETFTTLNNVGGLELANEIYENLESGNYHPIKFDINEYIEEGTKDGIEDTAPIISSAIDKRFNIIINKLQEKGWTNIDKLNLVFVGGTSDVLRNKIKERFGDKATVLKKDEAIFANVKGLYQIVRKKAQVKN